MSVTWSAALAWRMRQQLLDPSAPRRSPTSCAGWAPCRPPSGRARRPDPARPVPAGRGRRRPGRGPDHQDVRVPRRHPPDDARGRRRVPRPAGRQPDVGAAELAEPLRPDARRLAALREAVREALADGPLTRDELGAAVTARPTFRHLGFRLRRRVRHVAQAARLAGRHELRPAARRARHLPAPGHQPALGRPARPRRGRARGRSRSTSGRTGRRRPTTCTTGSARAWAPAASGSILDRRPRRPPRARSTSTANPPTSCARISTS